jgi:glycosyltransferase involved in cell wall biosynthesis
MKKTVSVVVVTYNRPKDVKDTIDSLLNQSVKPFEVIVIDDGSNPPLSIDYPNKNLKRMRFDQEVGLSNARNYGISIARGRYVAFIDDDAIADKCWLEEIQKGIGVADILGGPIRPAYQEVPPKWWNEKYFGVPAGIGNAISRTIWGCNMIVRKEAFNAVGLFNPKIGRQKGKLLCSEEMDFIDRATKKGLSVQFMPAVVVYHKVKLKRMTFGYIVRWNYYAGKSRKIREGPRSLKTYFDILLEMFFLFSPRIIISEKRVRIYKIARMAWLLGGLL